MARETYGLTQSGKRKAENVGEAQGLRWQILTHIEEKGNSSVRELSETLNASQSSVKQMVAALEREGYIISGGDDEGDGWEPN